MACLSSMTHLHFMHALALQMHRQSMYYQDRRQWTPAVLVQVSTSSVQSACLLPSHILQVTDSLLQELERLSTYAVEFDWHKKSCSQAQTVFQ